MSREQPGAWRPIILLLGTLACTARDGKSGANGADGASGVSGADGANGVDGADGQDGLDGADPSTIDRDGDGLDLLHDCDDSDATLGALVLRHLDYDGDGFGTPIVAQEFCAVPPGWVDDATDCNDLDGTVHPGATEVCNDGQDDDCDGLADDADDSLDATTGLTLYLDDDSDGFGGTEVAACAATELWVESGGDCDDTDDTIHPAAEELCSDGVDDNCNGSADDCAFDSALSEGSADTTLAGEAAGDRFGEALAVGDFDGDGFVDVLVGGPDADAGGTALGAVYVSMGSSRGASTTMVRHTGASAGSETGSAVVSLGDLDGDGTDDLAISSAGDDRAYVVYGGAGVWSTAGELASIATSLVSDAGTGRFGRGLAAAGDFDGDTVLDLVVGGAAGPSNAGTVYMLLGTTTSWSGEVDVPAVAAVEISGSTHDASFGDQGTLGMGDFDGDGLSDLLLGEPGESSAGADSGRAYLFLGASGWSGAVAAEDADTVFESAGATSAPALGSTVADVGDLDHDGHTDLALGAVQRNSGGTTEAGAVYVYGGSSSAFAASLDVSDASTRIDGVTTDGHAGAHLSTRLDVNEDGVDDLVTGATGYRGSATSGGLFVFYGEVGFGGGTLDLNNATIQIDGTSDGLDIGRAAGVGDIDSDGFPDIIVGVPGADSDQGRASVFYGAGY